jgi:hypothetical protein
MKIVKILAIAIPFSLVVSCGGGGGGSSSSSDPKSLFSLWVDVDTESPLELSDGDFNTDMDIAFYTSGGAQCVCDFTVLGNESAGTYIINSCYYVTNSSTEYFDCSIANETGTYSKKDDTLTIHSENGVTSTYQ